MDKQNTVQENLKPSPNNPSNKNTLIIVLLFVLFLITSGIAGYAVYQNNQLKKQITKLKTQNAQEVSTLNNPSPSPEPTLPNDSPNSTKNWKTYINETYNFKISYPPSWDFANYEKDLQSIYLDPQSVISEKQLKTVDRPGGLIIISLLENTKGIIGYDNFEIVTIKKGLQAQLFEKMPSDPRPNPTYKNKHELHYYIGDHIKISYYGDAEDTYLEEFNQILLSFEFIGEPS